MITFTTKVKEEMSKLPILPIEGRVELSAFLRFNGKIAKEGISLTIENASVARRIYQLIKETFGVNITVTVRNQKRFRIKQIYILKIIEKAKDILESLNIIEHDKKILPSEYFLDTKEEKMAYLKGLFLACGSISDPSTSGYHFEYVVHTKKEATFIIALLNEFHIAAKYLIRSGHYMVYVKSAEMISDLIKLFGAINSLFYFEDIRIYRDHKNMVNRLNNCEVANQERVIETGLKQMEDIAYLEEHHLIDLLDERTNEIIFYRKKYPETSYQELAEIVSLETEKPISKSGINHCFIKIRKLVSRHKNN